MPFSIRLQSVLTISLTLEVSMFHRTSIILSHSVCNLQVYLLFSSKYTRMQLIFFHLTFG
jgi:hypothetical protein